MDASAPVKRALIFAFGRAVKLLNGCSNKSKLMRKP